MGTNYAFAFDATVTGHLQFGAENLGASGGEIIELNKDVEQKITMTNTVVAEILAKDFTFFQKLVGTQKYLDFRNGIDAGLTN
jgi:hypothetical protein